MSRSVRYRYIKAEMRQLTHKISHLKCILEKLVALKHSDSDILAELNESKAKLMVNKTLLAKENK